MAAPWESSTGAKADGIDAPQPRLLHGRSNNDGVQLKKEDVLPIAFALLFPFPDAHFVVHDLPQLYKKPSAKDLLSALRTLALKPATFSTDEGCSEDVSHAVDEQGVPGYLTSIVSSSLRWIEDDDVKDEIWSLASTRLSERSGRSAAAGFTRSFLVADDVSISLHEPSLTEDNLGLKTWTSSLLLSRRLAELGKYVSSESHDVLELGSGTGLVGIAGACIWHTQILLTDLPEIVPNLQQNLTRNQELVSRSKGTVSARALDWSDESDAPRSDQDRFITILAADPIYSPNHPKWLVDTVGRWIRRGPDSRFIVELPLRDRYDTERDSLRRHLQDQGFELVDEGTETGYDDWHGRDGRPAEVVCWWSVWKLSDSALP